MLTDEQKLEAVELFAQGVSRIMIAQTFVDLPSTEIEASINAIGEPATKEKIADELRACDPTSSRFASTKYLAHYNNHVSGLRHAMTAKYDQLIASQIRDGQIISNSLSDLIEEVRANLDAAQEPEPTGNSEWNNTLRTLITLYKAQSEHNARGESLIHKFMLGLDGKE